MRKLFYFLATCGVYASNFQNPHAAFPVVTLVTPDPTHVHKNAIAPRLQWDQNFGYCGETGFICSGLYYGQYCSQYTARQIAASDPSLSSFGCPLNPPQYEACSQLFLGVNDGYVGDQMNLYYETWPHEGNYPPAPPETGIPPGGGPPYQGSTESFFVWVKDHVRRSRPVLIGVFNNEYLLYGFNEAEEGDPEYDHIIPLFGVGSEFPLDDGLYHATDRIYFSDNGLFGAFGVPPFLYSATSGDFQKTRAQANSPEGPVYSLVDFPDHYGIAILGIVDFDNATKRVRLEANINYEIPEIVQGKGVANPLPQSNSPPPSSPMTLTVFVEDLHPLETYYLYLYNDFNDVPVSNFNSTPTYTQRFVIGPGVSGTYTMTWPILSSDTVIFRAVPSTAP